MTYCVGILVRDGLVMIADTRTNAGVDNIATFRKLHLFEHPRERAIGLATAGNLAVSQSVVSLVTEGCKYSETGVFETLLNVPTMFRAAQLVGRSRPVRARHRWRIARGVRRAAGLTSRCWSAVRLPATACGCS